VTCAQQTTRGRDRGGSDRPSVGAAGSPAPHPPAVAGVVRRRRRRQRQRENNMRAAGADRYPHANAVEPKGGTAVQAHQRWCGRTLTQPPPGERRWQW